MYDATFSLPGHTMIEHSLSVPLDRFGALSRFAADEAAAIPEKIEVFAREYVRHGNERLPRLVYFQGGPGFGGPRMAPIGSWLDTALNHYRVVLLDERGTGRSHPIEAQAVSAVGPAPVQAAFISCFRQDSIAADAEDLRLAFGGEPWAVLGQSFGGFVVTAYLSQAPQGLSEAFITAGLPSVEGHADDVYRLTYAQTDVRNREFFARYPGDEPVAWSVAKHLADVEERLPTGERLTPGRFRQIGICLGRSYGLEQLHFLLEDPFWTVRGARRLRPQFLNRIGAQASLAPSPLYGVMHEAIYAQASTGATAWSADRIRGEFPQFRLPDVAAGAAAESELEAEGRGFRFTGEHMYPWQMREDPALAPIADAADALAADPSLRRLYDAEALAANSSSSRLHDAEALGADGAAAGRGAAGRFAAAREISAAHNVTAAHRTLTAYNATAAHRVPAAAWVYKQDMFVPYSISMETARLAGFRTLVSDTLHHDGLHSGGPQMILKLIEAVRR